MVLVCATMENASVLVDFLARLARLSSAPTTVHLLVNALTVLVLALPIEVAMIVQLEPAH